MKKILGTLFAVLLVAGCATPISPKDIANADYGSPPKDYKKVIEKEIGTQLLDPYSAQYEFSQPSKGYTKASPLFGTSQVFGYKVCGTVNAKNRMGGYVGRVPFFTLFRNGVLVTKLVGEAGGGLMNVNIENACTR